MCKDSTTTFTNLDSAVSIDNYLGDASKATWVYQGEPTIYKNESLLLTMPKQSAGTVMASTAYMWYGNVKAKFKTSRGKGVVTAFILLSDMKDEIDYEFVGADLEQAQSNYYFQGITDCKRPSGYGIFVHALTDFADHNSGNLTVSDTFHNFHEYEIKWTPDEIEWLVDGQSWRKKKRSDTWNETSQSWMFPQTPARVQLSIWPAGNQGNAKGTVDWAGGYIDWNSDDIKNVGYYYTTFEEVTIECYNATSAPGTNKHKSYTYNNDRGTNDTVVDGNNSTIIGSLLASGLDPDKGKTNNDNNAKSTQASIPGGSSGGTGNDHSGSDGSDGGSGGSSGSSAGNSVPGGAGGVDPKTCNSNGFHQDCGGGGSSATGSAGGGKSSGSKASASAFAIIIAGCALFWL